MREELNMQTPWVWWAGWRIKARANLGLIPRLDVVIEEIEEVVVYDNIYSYIRSTLGEHVLLDQSKCSCT